MKRGVKTRNKEMAEIMKERGWASRRIIRVMATASTIPSAILLIGIAKTEDLGRYLINLKYFGENNRKKFKIDKYLTKIKIWISKFKGRLQNRGQRLKGGIVRLLHKRKHQGLYRQLLIVTA